jgi:hypothetical protein
MRGTHRQPSGNAGLTTFSYYDLALLVLPIPLVVGLLVGTLSAAPPYLGVSTGALLSAIALAHLLFRDPPTRRGPRKRTGGPSA